MTPIRWFIFDLGGLFVADKGEAIHAAVANHVRVELERWLAAIRPHLGEATLGKMTLLQVYTQAVQDLGLTASPDELLDCHLRLYREFSSHQDQQMLELVRKLRPRHSVACLSNLEPEIAAIARASGLFAHFDRCYLSVELGLKKPDASIYQAVLRDLGCTAGETVLIDDRSDNVVGAQRVGLNTIRFQSRTQLAKALAKYTDA
jgi:putative hydrolase of the HAD superfamily